jgi:cell division protein FtsI (penicillin-binding protein 3)
MVQRNKRVRLLIALILFGTLYILILGKLFYWQVVRADSLKKISQSQSSDVLKIQAKRGEILSSDSFPLATNKISYLLYANPKVVASVEKYSKLLAPILEGDEASISALLSQNLFWVKIANRLSDVKKQEVEKLDLKGLGFQELSDRYYPEASMAAHMIGFLGKDKNDEDQGFFGLEGFYNSQLSGRNGSLYVVKDALGHPVINDIREEKKIDGRSISLNIDRTIQYISKKRITEGVDKYGAQGGSIIVMESKTGKILASASVPDFDPQRYWDFEDSFKDPVVSDLYEPGSTFKVLVMSAALDMDKVKPDTICNICNGPIQIGEYSISTWNKKYFPNTTMTEVLQHSDNTGMVFVGKKLGENSFLKYLKGFGLGQDTGVDLQGEVSGDLRNIWREIDLATASFGQGISITPIQLITAVNALANGGKLMKPYLVDEIIEENGNKIKIKPEVERQVVKSSTSKVITWMMVNAVEKGEAKWAKIPNYSIAGKTGTAQIPVAGHYDPNETIASFVGFFPAEDPKITMLVLVKRPKTSIYGSETAAPIFFKTARDIINYYGIPPSN